MAIVTRYFSTAAAGAGNGTTWADRAALFSGGNWSSVLTSLNFSGSDAYEARIGPGTYTCSQALAAGLFANAPTIANMLYCIGCDSSGNAIEMETEWSSAQPASWESSLPVIETTMNDFTTTLPNSFWQGIKFTASGRNQAIASSALFDFCVFENSTSNTSAFGVTTGNRLTNTLIRMSGTAFNAGMSGAAFDARVDNVRLEATNSPSSGNRFGVANPTSSSQGSLITAFGFDIGINCGQAQTGRVAHYSRCTLVGNRVGINANSQAGQTSWHHFQRNVVVNNSGSGIDAQSAANVFATSNRMRNNTSGNFINSGNYPTDRNYTASGADADEFVDYAGKDFRNKLGSDYHNIGIGAGDEPAVGGGTFPTAAEVLDGVVFGPTDNLTGTVVLPAASTVLDGTMYGPASATEGTVVLPLAAQVLDNVFFGAAAATEGTVVLPAVGNVRTSITFGPGSASIGTLSLPGVGSVLTSASYGAGGTEFIGTFASVAASSVVLGVQYGANNTQFTGTVRVPSAAQVLTGVSFGASDAVSGTVVLPAVGNVRSGVTFGPGSASTGTVVLPTQSQVLDGVSFDTASTGNVVLPTAAQVLSGVGFGPSSGTTGTITLPSAAQVLDAITFGPGSATTGTVVLPSVSDVRDGTFFGPGNASEGTLVVSGDTPGNYPAVGQVLADVVFGDANELTGTYVEVAVGDVRDGTLFGPGSSLEGTLVVGGGSPIVPGVVQGAPSASLALRPAMERRTPLLTLATVVDHLLLLDEINPAEPRSVDRASKAARDALSSFASYSTQGFRYYESRAKIVMPGTLALGSITVSDGVFTVDGGVTIPDWAPLSHVRIDRNANRVYPVLLVNGQVLTVDNALADGTYTNVYLEQLFFPLPRNFRRRGTMSDGKNNYPVEDMSGGAFQSFQDYYRWIGASEFGRRFSAITMDQRNQGDLMLSVWPPFENRVELSMFFERYPEALKHHRVGNAAATLGVSGVVATSSHAIFNSSHIGAAITIGTTNDQEMLKSLSSDSLVETQRIIRYVTSATEVVLDAALDASVSNRAFYISDIVDVQPGVMTEAYKRLAEHELLRQTKGSKADQKLQEFTRQLQMTQADDSRHKPSADIFGGHVGGVQWGTVNGRPT